MRTFTAVLAWLALIVVFTGEAARGEVSQSRTNLVRFEGTWGDPVPTHTATDLVVEFGERTSRFQVEEARVVSGGRSGPDVLAEAQGRRPAFRLHGPRELMARLEEARPGQGLELTGYVRTGSPDVSVSSVTLRALPHD